MCCWLEKKSLRRRKGKKTHGRIGDEIWLGPKKGKKIGIPSLRQSPDAN